MQANKSLSHNFYQHVKCATRGKITLDHLYSILQFVFEEVLHTKLSLTLHLVNLTINLSSWFMLTSKNETRKHQWRDQLKNWLDEADAKLQDCFASTDWNMFWDYSDGTEEYTTSVIGFINKCIDDVVPTVTVRTYPNQKPWITGSICTELKAWATALKEMDSNPKS